MIHLTVCVSSCIIFRKSFLTIVVLNLLLTPKQLEMHGCVLSSVATDDLVLKHQAISTHSAD